MKPGRINKPHRQAEQLRKKRAQATLGLATGARKPLPASAPPRPSVGLRRVVAPLGHGDK
jgi:hypothetical protein